MALALDKEHGDTIWSRFDPLNWPCARELGVTALYALDGGKYVSYILGAPDFVNRPFREVFAAGLPPMTPLVARSDGPTETN